MLAELASKRTRAAKLFGAAKAGGDSDSPAGDSDKAGQESDSGAHDIARDGEEGEENKRRKLC